MSVVILNEMQVFDQKVAAARARTQQRTHLVERNRIDLTALGGPTRPAAAVAVRPGAVCLDAVYVGIRKGCRAHSTVSIGPKCRFWHPTLNPLVSIQRLKISIVRNNLGLSKT